MRENYSKIAAFEITKKCLLVLSLFLYAIVFTSQARAEEDSWKFGVGLYGIYGSIDGDESNGSDIDIGADDLIDSLNFGVMGALGAYKGKWGFMVDFIYIDVEDDTNMILPNGSSGLSVNTNVELKNWIITPLVGYKVVQSDQVNMHLVAGARYLSLDADVTILGNSTGRPLLAKVSDSGSNWDAVIGLKGELMFNDRWYFPFYIDAGTGESDFTWQANGGLGYKFKACDVVLSYRYLSWDFDDNPVLDNMNISGPMLGVKFKF